MKKNLLIGALALLLLCGLIPRKQFLEDGGSVEYRALLYSVTDVREIGGNGPDEYREGLRVEVLGVKIFDSVE